mgnify:CR=1 FL=1
MDGHTPNSGRGSPKLSVIQRGTQYPVESPTEAHTPNSGRGNSNSPSFRGHAVAVESSTLASDAIRYAGFAHLSGLGETYDGPNDPTLTFFSVEDPQAWICSHEEWVPVEL